MPDPRRALVRPPGRRYPAALTRLDPPPPVDLDAARREHAGYVAALSRLGLEIEVLPADDEHPDAVFVQDRAAVVDGRAIVSRSAVASRAGEEEPIVAVLREVFPIACLRPPATLDWGDVLIAEDALYVGLSDRSNAAAVEQLREMLAPSRLVEGVPVPPDLLHLLSGCAPLGGADLLAVASLARFAADRGFRVLSVPEEEALGANVLAVGADVIVPAGYPKIAALLEASGRRVHPVSVREYEKRDGGVTCLSVLF